MQIDMVIDFSHINQWTKDYENIQSLLRQEGKDSWIEQETFLQPFENRCNNRTFPTSWFTNLQQLYAYLILYPKDKNNETLSIDVDDTSMLLDEAMEQYPDSHLLSHASEGYYIPLDFTGHALFDTKLPGGWIGSSYRLMDELVEMSVPLGITLTPLKGTVRRGGGFDISAQSIDELNNKEDVHPYAKERQVWFALFDAARLSKLNSCSIVLS